MQSIPVVAQTALLLTLSNVFMSFAWYAHLRDLNDRPWWIAAVASWGIAFIEYCLAVPANRIGAAAYTTAELKTMQEVITLTVFAVFSITYLGERITLNHAIGFILSRAHHELSCGQRHHVRADVAVPEDGTYLRRRRWLRRCADIRLLLTRRPPDQICRSPSDTQQSNCSSTPHSEIM